MPTTCRGEDGGRHGGENYVVIDAETNEGGAPTPPATRPSSIYEGEVNGVKVRTGFAMMRDTVNAYTLEEYAEITGVLRRGDRAHGERVHLPWREGERQRRAVGSTAGVNGFNTPNGREVLRALVGSNQMTGGCSRPACRTSRAWARPGTT